MGGAGIGRREMIERERPCAGSHELSDTSAIVRRPIPHAAPREVWGENRFNGGSKVGGEGLRGAVDEVDK